jgi:coatomer protein complex subunit alpha (xenin)
VLDTLKLTRYRLDRSQARTVIAQGDRNPQDVLKTSYDHFTEFDICAASLTPIYRGSPSVTSAFSQASYLPEFAGSICKVDDVVQVGFVGSGLRSRV